MHAPSESAYSTCCCRRTHHTTTGSIIIFTLIFRIATFVTFLFCTHVWHIYTKKTIVRFGTTHRCYTPPFYTRDNNSSTRYLVRTWSIITRYQFTLHEYCCCSTGWSILYWSPTSGSRVHSSTHISPHTQQLVRLPCADLMYTSETAVERYCTAITFGGEIIGGILLYRKQLIGRTKHLNHSSLQQQCKSE